MTRVAYIVFHEPIWAPLQRRQVVDVLLSMMRMRRSIEIHLVAFLPWHFFRKHKGAIRFVKSEMKNQGIRVHLIPTPVPWPGLLPFRNRSRNKGWKPPSTASPFLQPFIIFFVAPVLVYLCLRNGINILHGRSYPVALSALVASWVSRTRGFVFDPRSDFPEENVVAGSFKSDGFAYRLWKAAEKLLLQKSLVTVCISEEYVDHFEEHGVSFRRTVIPNNVDTDLFVRNEAFRECYRRANGLVDDKFVLCYLGGMSQTGWHRASTYAQVIRYFERLEAPHLFLFLVPEEAHDLLVEEFMRSKIPHDSYLIEHPDFEEVPRFLSVADVGIMYQERRRLALGTKVVEYASIGLPAIVNSNCLGAARAVRNRGLGSVIDVGLGDLDVEPTENPEYILRLPEEIKSHNRRVACDCYSTEHVANAYMEIYG